MAVPNSDKRSRQQKIKDEQIADEPLLPHPDLPSGAKGQPVETLLSMRRYPSERCVHCGLAFVIGPLFVDYIELLQRRGLKRTLNFDYKLYCRMWDFDEAEWPKDVTLDDCDSVFLGDLIDEEMNCPKCGEKAFPEEGPSHR